MIERKSKRNVNRKLKSSTTRKNVNSKKKTKKTKKNISYITIVDYVFLVSLVLSIIFGIQTNTAIFFWPFTIVLLITIICMCIILVNAIYSKIKKKFNKNKEV